MIEFRLRPVVGTVVVWVTLLLPLGAGAQYTPERHNWETRRPGEVGMNATLVEEAVQMAIDGETPGTHDMALSQQLAFGREPHSEPIGPFRTRGDAAGIIIRNGYIVTEWGDPYRVDMTHSVSKSFLSTTVGLAWTDGLIDNIDDTVAPYMAPVLLPEGDGERNLSGDSYSHAPVTLFEDAHNRKITWRNLLQQNSAWRGTLWGKPDWADRPAEDRSTWLDMDRPEPGTVYEYNDTRVNLLALLATQVWREPLPNVLRRRVMDPIGASNTWRWHGYENSWITQDGQRIQIVSGGGHWGGGMFLSARDQARLGMFTLRRGLWKGEQLLPEEWFDMATTPSTPNPGYGFMNYFLNGPGEDGRKTYPSAPDEAYAHRGSGTNLVYVDPVNDLVIVARWIQGGAIDPFLGKVIESIN